MTQQVNAIYDHGILRLLGPLDLNDQEVVLVSVEKVVSDAVGDQEPTLYEVLDEVGLIGCVKDLPPDLSRGPQHLQGFGKNGK